MSSRIRGRAAMARKLWVWWLGIAATLSAGWLAGLIWFAETIPTAAGTPGQRTDAVVVLTGGTGRLEVGIDLLAQGRAKKLFISGVYRGVDVSEILRLVKKQGKDLECCMALGHLADNTRGNAAETADWMKAEGYRSLRLVTANYHMRRSWLEFRRAMPKVAIIAHPVSPRGFKAREWWLWPGSLRLVTGEYLKYLIALVRMW